MKRLKKLIKEILKKELSKYDEGQPWEGYQNLHLYSGCSGLGQLYSGAGSGASNDFLNQGPPLTNPNSMSSAMYRADLQGPAGSASSEDFTLAEVLNNNNVIHNLWLTPSIGQVIKMYTCPPTAENCQPTCMKYEGPVGIYQLTDAENLDQVNAQEAIESNTGYNLYTYGNASNLGLPMTDQNPTRYGTLGTFNSCNECGGEGCEVCHGGWECTGEGCNKCAMGWPLGKREDDE